MATWAEPDGHLTQTAQLRATGAAQPLTEGSLRANTGRVAGRGWVGKDALGPLGTGAGRGRINAETVSTTDAELLRADERVGSCVIVVDVNIWPQTTVVTKTQRHKCES
jgi:hypothetical protein